MFKIQAMKFLRINKIVFKTGVGSRYVSACLQSQHWEGRARQLSVKASQGYIVRSGFITQTATKARHGRKTFTSNIWEPKAGGQETKHRVFGMGTPEK